MPKVADRVKETSTTTGTGTFSLTGAVSTFRGFVAGIGDGEPCYYAIIHQTLDEWEVGEGTVTDGSPDTLSRTTIFSSSNAGAAVNFSAGTKDVFVTLPASKAGMPYWLEKHPDTRPASPNAKSDFWGDETDESGPVNGLDAKWTAISAGSTRLFQHGRLYWKATAADLKHMIVQSLPSTPYRVTVPVAVNSVNNTAFTCGICFRDSASGRIQIFALIPNTNGVPSFAAAHYSGEGAGTFVGSDMTTVVAPGNPLYLRVKDDGTNWLFQYSVVGGDADDHYHTLLTLDRDGYLAAPNQFGLLVNGVTVAHSAAFGPFVVS